MKKTNIAIFLLLNLIGIFDYAVAQQNPQFSQYLFNGVVINPAYAGSKEYLNLNGFYRKQWVGIENSPSSQTISADGPFAIRNTSWGAFITNDILGHQRTTSFFGAFNYRITTSSRSRLALGVSAGAAQYQVNGEELITDTPNDPAVPNQKSSVWTPDARVGLYFNTPSFFAGISVWEILSGPIVDNALIADPSPHIYLSSGFAIPLSSLFVLRPSFLIKEDFKGPTNADATAFIIFKNKIWAGASYRSRVFTRSSIDEVDDLTAKDAIAFLLQILPMENFRIGYSYDFSTTAFRKYGTHELSLGYFFIPRTQAGMLTPRYF